MRVTCAVERQPTVFEYELRCMSVTATMGRTERTVYVRSHSKLFTAILSYEINARKRNGDGSLSPTRLFVDNADDVTSENADRV
jgi:hypothetical protein